MTFSPSEAYFDLQLRFAGRYSALTGAPITEGISRCTNLRRRFGLKDSAGDDAWAAFLGNARACSQHNDLLHLVRVTHDAAPRPSLSPFGCFTYDAPGKDGTLRLHFMPDRRHRHSSPLAGSSMHQRRGELRALFAEIRQRYPEDTQVRGLSWLYQIQAYKRLFPPEYVVSLAPAAGPLHLNGSSTWGQVVNHRHELRAGVAERVLAGLQPGTVASPWQAFPLQALGASCTVSHFFNWFALGSRPVGAAVAT